MPWRFSKKRSERSISYTATSLNNLAAPYNAMGDYAKAEPLYRHASAIFEKALGAEHPLTAKSLKNLAFLNIDLGDAGGAQELAVRVYKRKRLSSAIFSPSPPNNSGWHFKRKPISFRFRPRWAAHLMLPKRFCALRVWCLIHWWRTAWWPKPARIPSSVKSSTNCARPSSGIRSC